MWKQSQYTFGQMNRKWVCAGEVVCINAKFRSCFSTEINHWWLIYISTTNAYD